MALDFERARQLATRGLRALRDVPGGIQRRHGGEGPPVEVAPFRSGEYSPGAEVAKAGLSLISGARARANFARAQRSQAAQDEYANLQMAALRRRLAPGRTVDVPGVGPVEMDAATAARYGVALAMAKARANRPAPTARPRARTPAASALERSIQARIQDETQAAEAGAVRHNKALSIWLTEGDPVRRQRAAGILGANSTLVEQLYAAAAGDKTGAIRAQFQAYADRLAQSAAKREAAGAAAGIRRRHRTALDQAAAVQAAEAGVDLSQPQADEQAQRDEEFQALLEAWR